MRKFIWILALVAAALGVYFVAFHKPEEPAGPEPEKQKPVAQSKYSAAFNTSVGKAMADYDALREQLVNWDSTAVKTQAAKLQTSLGAVAYDELHKDTAIYETAISYKDMFAGDLTAMQTAPNLTEARRSFNSLSQNLYDLLRVIRYDAAPTYLIECNMAFNDTEPGVWLNSSSTVRNPYMGLHHPTYKGGMLKCGEPKDSLLFAVNK
ncbi:MAG: DUF3347 domain-containing protein [Chitinophagaceae bacterium]|nr:MAG: DUF3347 domain-containing protein [Chitinophagaceae bacterium]